MPLTLEQDLQKILDFYHPDEIEKFDKGEFTESDVKEVFDTCVDYYVGLKTDEAIYAAVGQTYMIFRGQKTHKYIIYLSGWLK